MSDASPRYDGFAIDLDGVVWLSREPIDGAAEAIGLLRDAGHPVVFVTNDPRSTRAELAARLTEVGAPTEADDVLTSATAAAARISEEQPGARVLAVGTDSLRRELAADGLGVADRGVHGGDFDAVIVGGGAGFDYEVLAAASAAIRGGARLWATNVDPTYPTRDGLVPGTGALVAAIETASGAEATNVGKPEAALFDAAALRLGATSILMAGDSLVSDIAGASAAGLATALVLTGRDGAADVDSAEVAPDHIFGDLAELARELS